MCVLTSHRLGNTLRLFCKRDLQKNVSIFGKKTSQYMYNWVLVVVDIIFNRCANIIKLCVFFCQRDLEFELFFKQTLPFRDPTHS